jgi:CubicO group peptidase (beta-lactamase class C family)
MQQFVDEGKIAGGVALVARDGRIVHLGAAGWADVESRRPMRTDSVFAIMSMTKPIAAAAALKLCEEGRLSLDEPVARRLPEFAEGPRARITLRQLLSHTSGLGGNQQNVGDLAQTAAEVARRPLSFEPGAKWGYSPGLSVAGRLVEIASGESFDAYVAKTILAPLGMTDTTFFPTPEQLARAATIYKRAKDGGGLEPAENWFLGPLESRTPNPSGGLYSTAEDLLRFWQMLLNGGELDGVRILSEATVKEMTTPQTGDLPAGFVPGSQWGLGVGIVRDPQGVTAMLSPGTFGHGGAFGTQVWADPKRKAVFLLLIQRIGIVNSDASEFREGFQEAAAAALDGM